MDVYFYPVGLTCKRKELISIAFYSNHKTMKINKWLLTEQIVLFDLTTGLFKVARQKEVCSQYITGIQTFNFPLLFTKSRRYGNLPSATSYEFSHFPLYKTGKWPLKRSRAVSLYKLHNGTKSRLLSSSRCSSLLNYCQQF